MPAHAATTSAARLALGLAMALGAVACSSETEPAADTGPTGNPTLAIEKPVEVDGAPVCASIGTDPAYRMPFYVVVSQLLLRPPGVCGSYAQCGSLALYVNGVLNSRSSVPAIALEFQRLADRYHDGTPNAATGEPDVLEVEIAALAEDGDVLLDHDGNELRDGLRVVSVVACPPPSAASN